MTTDVHVRLMAFQTELTRVRRDRARKTSGPWAWLPEVQMSPLDLLRGLLGFLLGTAAMVLALLVLVAALTGDVLLAIAGALVLGVPLAGASFWLGRPLGRSVVAALQELSRLSRQESQLLREAACLTPSPCS